MSLTAHAEFAADGGVHVNYAFNLNQKTWFFADITHLSSTLSISWFWTAKPLHSW